MVLFGSVLGSDNWNVAYGDMSSDVSKITEKIRFIYNYGGTEIPGIFSFPACNATLWIVA